MSCGPGALCLDPPQDRQSKFSKTLKKHVPFEVRLFHTPLGDECGRIGPRTTSGGPDAAGSAVILKGADMAHSASEMQQCIQECLNCHVVCLATKAHCMQKGGPHAQPQHIRELADCAQICITSADSMLRGSQMHSRTCAVCAEMCEPCEQSCAQMNDDQMMQQCIDACRRCAESCRRMAGSAAH